MALVWHRICWFRERSIFSPYGRMAHLPNMVKSRTSQRRLHTVSVAPSYTPYLPGLIPHRVQGIEAIDNDIQRFIVHELLSQPRNLVNDLSLDVELLRLLGKAMGDNYGNRTPGYSFVTEKRNRHNIRLLFDVLQGLTVDRATSTSTLISTPSTTGDSELTKVTLRGHGSHTQMISFVALREFADILMRKNLKPGPAPVRAIETVSDRTEDPLRRACPQLPKVWTDDSDGEVYLEVDAVECGTPQPAQLKRTRATVDEERSRLAAAGDQVTGPPKSRYKKADTAVRSTVAVCEVV
ncbi:uncharacterized protein V1513DRAFT_427869 [Lipomyces chichibuensis]|uniref:uncharacterized protein n=1 Tax=Lipomyces chichibuensis TaxID=1546026 RepID=UPI00334371F4